MKNLSHTIHGLCFILLISSCSERFPIDLPKTKPKIVIEALITDSPGPYYVRLTKSTDTLKVPNDTMPWVIDVPEPVLHALVIISGIDGINDTLKPSHLHNLNYYNGIGDSILGYYCTREWTAKVGVRYYLDIYNEGKHYHSEETMVPTLVIDTCNFELQKGVYDWGSYCFLPIVRFKTYCDNSGYYMVNLFGTNSWSPNLLIYHSLFFSLFPSSKLTDCSIVLYNIADPDFPYYKDNNVFRDSCSLGIYSLSKTAYYFHSNLLKQLVNDGGAFKPSPATPSGNISGDAIGLFQVSSVSRYIIPRLY